MATSAAKRQKAHSILQSSKKDQSPKWDGAENWSGEKFNAHFRKSMEWYRLEKSVKDLKPKLIEWMHSVDFSRTEINTIRKIKDKYFNTTMMGVAGCLANGMPSSHPEFNHCRDSGLWLRKEINKVIELGIEDLDEEESKSASSKSSVPIISIQDRIREQAGDISEELDLAIDSWIKDPENFDPKAFKIINLLRTKGAKSAQSRYIKEYYLFAHTELQELSSGQADEQLREAYKHNSRRNVKKLIEFYESIMAACDQISAEAKLNKKVRAKKVKPAEELVKKLKFAAKDDKLGIVSVPPANIIGAQGVVLFNIKTRKLAYLISKTTNGLEVKGTSVLNISEKSLQKTLRNPSAQLKEFKDQNTQKRFETWFDKNIKTTGIIHTGRLNEETIILKIFK